MAAEAIFKARGRRLDAGQRSELTVIDADTGARHVLFQADVVIEAPNWTTDGQFLIL